MYSNPSFRRRLVREHSSRSPECCMQILAVACGVSMLSDISREPERRRRRRGQPALSRPTTRRREANTTNLFAPQTTFSNNINSLGFAVSPAFTGVHTHTPDTTQTARLCAQTLPTLSAERGRARAKMYAGRQRRTSPRGRSVKPPMQRGRHAQKRRASQAAAASRLQAPRPARRARAPPTGLPWPTGPPSSRARSRATALASQPRQPKRPAARLPTAATSSAWRPATEGGAG